MTMEDKKAFLGTGWGFPPTFSKTKKTVQMTSLEEDVKRSLHILLSTKQGERIMQPTYGCNLEEFLFTPLNITEITYISELVRNAILYHEPRIELLKVDVSESNILEGELLISIDYYIRATNTRSNMVFPFYKTEGTETN